MENGNNFKYNQMTKEQIAEKYGIELIMREMWVWDSDKAEANLRLVTFKPKDTTFVNNPYFTWSKQGSINMYSNASDTNPNDPQEPKIGDLGYFWDKDEVFYAYGKLRGIDKEDVLPYLCEGLSWHPHFLHKKQPWMK